jgi:DNA (cytosine-5)-methyltransferase 1
MTTYLIDLFCGAGGVSTGAKQIGMVPLLAVDAWDIALDVYRQNYPSVEVMKYTVSEDDVTQSSYSPLLRRIAQLRSSTLRSGDSLHVHASPPCQNFSTANPHKSVDEGATLLHVALQLLRIINPDSWSVEEVNSSHVKDVFSQYNVQFRLLNACDFGLPQTRKRLIATSYAIPEQKEIVRHVPMGDVLPDLANKGWFIRSSANSKKFDGRGRITSLRSVDKDCAFTITSLGLQLVDRDEFSNIRGLTVQELCRLQGFPDGYFESKNINVVELKQLLGNAVPPPFASGFLLHKPGLQPYRHRRRQSK